MKLLIFSDSHGISAPMREAIRRHRDADAILFLGDGLRDFERAVEDVSMLAARLAVQGNCDLSPLYMGQSVPKTDFLSIEGHRILFTHGDMYGVKGGLGALQAYADRAGADIVLFGHTHVPYESYMTIHGASMWLFNPGSIGRGRNGQQSYGLLTLTERDVLFSHGTI